MKGFSAEGFLIMADFLNEVILYEGYLICKVSLLNFAVRA